MLLAALAALLAMTAVAHANAPVVSLDVSPSSGTDSDTYTATVRVEMPGVSGPDRYVAPAFTGFTITDKKATKSTTRQYDPQAGLVLAVTQTYQYQLKPTRTGKLNTGRARAIVDGTEYESADFVVNIRSSLTGGVGTAATSFRDPTAASGVGAPGFRPPTFPTDDRPDVFLYAVVSDSSPYVGEQITVTWLLYTRDEILKFDPKMPRLDGLWSETLHEPNSYFRYHADVVDGVTYQVVVVSKRALFATRSGKLTIGAYSARVSTLYTPLGRAEEVKSAPIELDVRPLPDGAPSGFDPTYVGDYSIETEIDRDHIDAGESLTLTVTIRGRGAIRRISPPELDVEGFALRAPRDYDENIHSSTSLVSGWRTYRYWTTPTRGGKQEFPALAIHYFSPERQAYQTAKSQPIELTVSGDPTALNVARTGRQNTIARDIRLIRDGPEISSRRASHLYQSTWFWLVSALPLACFLGLIISDRVRGARAQHSSGRRKRRARGAARRRLRFAQLHVRNDRPAEFFAELSRTLYEVIEQCVGEPVQSLTRDELSAVMRRKGFSEPLISRIGSELDACDFARFASSSLDVEDARQAFDRLQTLLGDIEAVDLTSHVGEPAEAR